MSTTVPPYAVIDQSNPTIRAVLLFRDSRDAQAALWESRFPGEAFPGAKIRPAIEPERCDNCAVDMLLRLSAFGECEHDAWSIAMEAAGLPLRPYHGHRHLLAEEAVLAAQRAAQEARHQEVIRVRDLLWDRYRREGEYVHPVPTRPRGLPIEVEDAFWQAIRDGTGPEFLDGLEPGQNKVVVRGVPREESTSCSRSHDGDEPGRSHLGGSSDAAASTRSASVGASRSRKHRASNAPKVLRFPYPRWQRKNTGNHAFVQSVWRWARVKTLRTLNEAQEAGEPVLSDPAELAQWVVDEIYEHGAKYIVDMHDRQISTRYPNELQDSQIEPLAASVVAHVLDEWNPEFMEVARRRGGVGGRVSRRGPKYTMEALEGIEHLSKAQQADVLGCSIGTITNLRKQHRDHYGW